MTVAWITGGGTGIGRALAENLYRDGVRVVISGRRKDVLEKAVLEITSRSGQGEVLALAGDASNSAHVSDVVAQASKRWGDINLLINNAGVNFDRGWLDMAPAEFERSFELNCLTAIQTTHAILPGMIKTGGGAVVNIVSIYGKWASARSPFYSVGKYALAGFTDALRQSLTGTPIHVLGVYPGYIRTDMTLPFVEQGALKSKLGKSPDQMAKAILKALRRKKAELYYPWYVFWALRFHRWFPDLSDHLAQRIKR
jgi:short-subunit dehydrogenase